MTTFSLYQLFNCSKLAEESDSEDETEDAQHNAHPGFDYENFVIALESKIPLIQ